MKKLTTKKIFIIVIIFCIITGLIFELFYGENNVYEYLDASKYDSLTTDLSKDAIDVSDEIKEYTTGWTSQYEETIYVDETFTSELPIVVIDTGSDVPSVGSVYDSDLGYYVPLEDDGYAYGSMYIIDTGNLNTLTSNANYESSLKLKVRGNSSSNYDKKQYLLKLLDENGNSSEENLFGMGSASDWILSVSFIDKSLLRNYIAYETASLFMEYTSSTQYVEVIYKTEEGYSYLGVSMLIEVPEYGENRVDIPSFSNNGGNVTYLMRRDRYDEDGFILDNYATENELLSGYIEVLYPDIEDISQSDIELLNSKINDFEEVIFSDDYEIFVTYRDMIDVDTFVDYFIINEFFLNYDAGYNSTYFYADEDGLINMGPVWDFDQAIDNNEHMEANLYTTAFHDSPWFRQLLKDPWFVEQIILKYDELREYELSNAHIETLIDTTVEYLGSAIDRDWDRWGYYYKSGIYLKNEYQFDRNTYTYEDEVEKLKYVILTHASWLDDNLDSLYQFSEFDYVSDDEYFSFPWGEFFAVIFVFSWISSVVIIQRRVD